MAVITNYQELAKALERKDSYLKISGDLAGQVLKIQALDYEDYKRIAVSLGIQVAKGAFLALTTTTPAAPAAKGVISLATATSMVKDLNLAIDVDTVIAIGRLIYETKSVETVKTLKEYQVVEDNQNGNGILTLSNLSNSVSNNLLLSGARAAYEKFLGKSFSIESGEFNSEVAEEEIRDERGVLNIVLLGATGVGKSSLVNAMFGKGVVKSGDGEPVTQFLDKIHVPKKGLTLWDTKGIEAADYEATKNQLINDITSGFNKAFESKDDNEMPHVAWLCIKESSRRIEGREYDLLDLMKKFDIPTVIVFTDTQDEAGENFYNESVEKLTQKYGDFLNGRFVRVNSVPYTFKGHEIPAEGLEELLAKTNDCLASVNRSTDEQRKKHISALFKAQEVDLNIKKEAMIAGARQTVHMAAAAAGAAGAIPIPMADAPIIAAIQSKMIFSINAEFEVEMEKNQTLSLVTSILGLTAFASIGKKVVTSVLKLIPFAGAVAGGTVSAATAASITEAIGHTYIQVLLKFYNEETGKVHIDGGVIEIMKIFSSVYRSKA